MHMSREVVLESVNTRDSFFVPSNRDLPSPSKLLSPEPS